jgi:hypothetical protein
MTGSLAVNGTATATQFKSSLNTINSQIDTGWIEVQSYGTDNSWVGANVYYNGTNFIRRNTGFSSQLYFQTNGGITLFNSPSGTAGSVVNLTGSFTIANSGAATFFDRILITSNGGTNPVLAIRQTNAATQGYDFETEDVSVGRLDLYGVTSGGRVQMMTWLKSTGKVGIGTTSPANKLFIVASGTATTNGNNSGLFVSHLTTGATTDGIGVGSNGSASYKWIQSYNGDLSLNPAGNNVGIGTTSPARILHTSGTGATAEWILEDTASTANTKKFNILVSGGLTQFRALNDANSGGTIWLTVNNSSGNVGIGTTTPSGSLHISTNSGLLTQDILIVQGGGSPSGNFGFACKANNGDKIFYTDHLTYNVYSNTAAGKFGIGTASPATKLDIRGTSASANATLQIVGNGISTLLLGQNSDGGVIRGQGGNDVLSFWTGGTGDTGAGSSGTEKMRITSDGYLRMAGAGIQFNGDTAAANSLDDYEEGTWTPVIACSSGVATYANQLGFYTKIGRVVTITWFISFTKNTLSGGTVGLTGLPFNLISGTFYPQGTVMFDNLSTVTNNITLQGDNNAASGTFIQGNGGTTNHLGLATTTLGTGAMACRGTLTYFTA